LFKLLLKKKSYFFGSTADPSPSAAFFTEIKPLIQFKDVDEEVIYVN